MMDAAISCQIETRLKEFRLSVGDDAPYEHRLAAEFGVLPLFSDWTECRAIRPDGEIVSFMFDNSWHPEIETPNLQLERDVRLRHLALFQGAKKYPELSVLIPSRTIGAVDCRWCVEIGECTVLSPEVKDSVCYCGGMGWLPENYPLEFPPMPIDGETRMTDELFGGTRLVTLIGTVVGALCVGAIWGYLSESMGFRASVFIRYILFATCSYLIVGLLSLRRTGNSRRRIPGSVRIAVLGSMVFVISMYLVYAFPDVWKFGYATAEPSVFNYVFTEVKDLGMALVLHTIVDSLIVLLVLGLVSHIASIISGISAPE